MISADDAGRRPRTEWEAYILDNYAVSTMSASRYPYKATELTDRNAAEAILQEQAAQLGQPVNRVVGMLFAKRYSVFVMGILSALSLYDRMPDVAPDKVRFRITHEAEMNYMLEEADVSFAAPTGTDERRANAGAHIQRLMGEHVGPVFAGVAACTGARPAAMWSLLSTNIQNMYLRLSVAVPVEADDGRRAAIVEADRLALLDRSQRFLPGLDGNPLAVKLRQFRHPVYDGPAFYMRNACCLAYTRIEDDGQPHGYCTTCPKAKPEEILRKLAVEHGA